MRMWMVEPAAMCDKHLLGEHVEHHMLVGQIQRRRKLDGYAEKRLIEPAAIKARHDALALEMKRRGFRHASPLDKPDVSYLSEKVKGTTVDPADSRQELCRRCPKCAGSIHGFAKTST